MSHQTVLLQEAVDALAIGPGSIVVDGTFGAGGHSLLIASLVGRSGVLIACDRDRSVFETPVVREIGALTRFIPCVADFRDIKHTLTECAVGAPDAVLLDLGLSSTELEESGRGFSFQKDEPLLMTFAKDPAPDAVTAATIVNEWSEETIRDILSGFGEEKYAYRIAQAVVTARRESPILTTDALVEIIKSATPSAYQHTRTHYATRVFQALRMAVNDELGAVKQMMVDGCVSLKPGGRMAIITFHSVEDRIVKQTFRLLREEGVVTLVTKKPITPSDHEISVNRRSRSAHLRVVEKVRTSS